MTQNINPRIFASKPHLITKMWDSKTLNINSVVRINLLKIANDFISKFPVQLKIEDITLTGSLANYNWNEYSDVDLHIVIDIEKYVGEEHELILDYLNAKKTLWNKEHDIRIFGHEVEVYLQDINEPHQSSGIYSLLKNEWLVIPQPSKSEIDYNHILKKTQDFISKIEELAVETEQGQFEKVSSNVDALLKKLKKYRKAGLEKKGEFSTENLVFKSLRDGGYIEKLIDLRTDSYDADMSIEETILDINELLEMASLNATGVRSDGAVGKQPVSIYDESINVPKIVIKL